MARAHGIDISKWVGAWDPDAGKSIDFAIVRASYGISTGVKTDQRWDHNLPILLDKIKIRGAYHYLSSEWPWRAQADYFLNLVKDQDLHILALDFEKLFNFQSAAFAHNAILCLEYLQQNSPDTRVIFYSGVYVVKDWMDPFSQEWRDWPLWIARYPFAPDRENAQPKMTEINQTAWKLWQYSADGNNKGSEYGVEAASIDLNVYNGSVRDMEKWLGVSEIPDDLDPGPPLPIPEDPPDFEKLELSLYESIAANEEAIQAATDANIQARATIAELNGLPTTPDTSQITFLWPTVNTTVTQAFGMNPAHYGQWGLPGHEGIDMRTDGYGTAIRACWDGEVFTNSRHNAYGWQVRIKAMIKGVEYHFLYAHMNEQSHLSVGSKVKKGELVGVSGSTGNSTGPHLHFSLKKKGATDSGETNYPYDIIDPSPFFAELR